MDEITRKRYLKEMAQRKQEDEEFNKIIDARLKRQAILKSSIHARDKGMVGDVEVIEEEDEEEIYTVTRDEDGELEVEKLTDQED